MMLFKVLLAGESCHGGDREYPPAGEWTRATEPCCAGWHLTSDPLRWWMPRAELWLAEGKLPMHGDGEDRAAFSRVRLVEQITKDWPYLVMFPRVQCFLAASARSFDPKADIDWVNLTRAYLAGANLAGAYLMGANLAGANLAEVYLAEVYLAGADLAGAYRPIDPPDGWIPDKNGYLKAT